MTKSRIRTIAAAVAILLMAASLVACLVVIRGLNRNNLFSKSIYASNNYFLNFSEDDGDSPTSEDNLAKVLRRLQEQVIELSKEIGIYNSGWEAYAYVGDDAVADDASPVEIPGGEDHVLEAILAYAKDTYFSMGICAAADRLVEAYVSDMLAGIDFHFSSETETVIDVPYISQEGTLPNGCEAVCAVMLLRHAGFDISAEDFIDGYLPMGEVTIRWGCRYGPDPKLAYAGDPRSEKNGLGCFAPVIATALNDYLPSDYRAQNVSGASLATLKSRYIDKGIPVAVWVTVGMEKIDKIIQWQSTDRDESFLYPANEHCMVLCGYDGENYIFADPYGSAGIVKYPAEEAVTAYNSMGMQAVVITFSP